MNELLLRILHDVLAKEGVAVDEMSTELRALVERMGGAAYIPATVLERVANDYLSSGRMAQLAVRIAAALAEVLDTGRGPVQHDPVDLA